MVGKTTIRSKKFKREKHQSSFRLKTRKASTSTFTSLKSINCFTTSTISKLGKTEGQTVKEAVEVAVVEAVDVEAEEEPKTANTKIKTAKKK